MASPADAAADLAQQALALIEANPHLKITVKHAKTALKACKGDPAKAVEMLAANPASKPAKKVGPGTLLMQMPGNAAADDGCEFGINIMGTQALGPGAATFTCNKPKCEAHEPKK